MAVTCGTCSATWTGLRIEHCPSCHATFTGASSGDMHRVGDHAVFEGPDRRRCLSPEEMTEKGMSVNSRAHWTTAHSTEPWWKPSDGDGDLG